MEIKNRKSTGHKLADEASSQRVGGALGHVVFLIRASWQDKKKNVLRCHISNFLLSLDFEGLEMVTLRDNLRPLSCDGQVSPK